MKQKSTYEMAGEFLKDYRDPQIKKRLYYEFWADRKALVGARREEVWQEVRRLTYHFAVQKRLVLRQRHAQLQGCNEIKM